MIGEIEWQAVDEVYLIQKFKICLDRSKTLL